MISRNVDHAPSLGNRPVARAFSAGWLVADVGAVPYIRSLVLSDYLGTSMSRLVDKDVSPTAIMAYRSLILLLSNLHDCTSFVSERKSPRPRLWFVKESAGSVSNSQGS